mgnify:CR=1 FL=1
MAVTEGKGEDSKRCMRRESASPLKVGAAPACARGEVSEAPTGRRVPDGAPIMEYHEPGRGLRLSAR